MASTTRHLNARFQGVTATHFKTWYTRAACVLSAQEASLLFSLPFFPILFHPTSFDNPVSSLWQSCRVYIGWCCQVILTDNPPRPLYRYSWKRNDGEEPQKGWVLSFKSNLWGPFMKLWEYPPACWWFLVLMSFQVMDWCWVLSGKMAKYKVSYKIFFQCCWSLKTLV